MSEMSVIHENYLCTYTVPQKSRSHSVMEKLFVCEFMRTTSCQEVYLDFELKLLNVFSSAQRYTKP